jgi:hypothetical protein
MGAHLGPTCETSCSLPAGSLVWAVLNSAQSDPAARAAMLCAAIVTLRSCQQGPLRAAPLLGFRGYVLRCIQDALKDSVRRGSEHTALAIASTALLDLTLGYPELHEIHMGGIAQMKAGRGGSLGRDFDQLLCWYADLKPALIMRAHFAISFERSCIKELNSP